MTDRSCCHLAARSSFLFHRLPHPFFLFSCLILGRTLTLAQGQIAALSEGRGAANHQATPTPTSTAADTVRLILAWNTDSPAAKEKARSEVKTLVGGASVVLKFDQLQSLNMDIITVSRQASEEVLNALKKSPAVSVIEVDMPVYAVRGEQEEAAAGGGDAVSAAGGGGDDGGWMRRMEREGEVPVVRAHEAHPQHNELLLLRRQ
ncbi:unnamed protein product [Vitrella brassicaformis CCMP3155]|uniref:Inhibitor I9 domain-containing protein n=1 Tax=Vitrella brassicaformis (strain CCMP3155) TaxID=1169540 RepID=A0A0G4EUU6_VITBC|nr:unnamed protein product [Vitrella brassicaformis CCMP3155]|mmetsp:Transcript_7664/g.18782  ORF Transcript_7664/g.18782 Transcript_7664/m.18782 type:complete len:205 (-) Transcript_7664:301-915(-)|eukprot:CEM01806.1 unnamed protein product [Vitrella brassicaformis CCMP3155]